MGAGNQKRKIIGLAATSAPMSAVFSFSHGGFFHTPSAWECVPRSSASHSRSRNNPQNKRPHPPIVILESPPQDGLAFPPKLQGNSFTPSPVVNIPPTPEQPPRKKQHRHSGIFRVANLGPGTMPRGKYPESPAPAGSHALISRTPTPGGMLHANLGLPRPPPRNFQPPLPQQPPKQTQQRRHNVPPVQSLRDSAAATPVGCAARAGMPPHWRECEAPLRRTQRDGADETIGRILSHPPWRRGKGGGGRIFS